MKPVVFGKYTLLTHLARGGMADLYLARASEVAGAERLVVIKLVTNRLARDKSVVTMFADEARIACTLDHPNIGQVFETGVVSGQYYLAMEYIHGKDLRAIGRTLSQLDRPRIPIEIGVHIGVKVCAALEYAHGARGLDGRPLNIIHRDVSPSNIMLTYHGNVKLVDFGIAKAANRSTLTQPGWIKGKVRYLSPEQISGTKIDQRSDVFTLAVSLWEAMMGRVLFAGDREAQVIGAIAHGDIPRPTQLVDGFPRELEQILLKALSTSADERYESAAEMHVALARFAESTSMTLSELKVAQFMRETFIDQVQAWEHAQQQGLGLLEYLLEIQQDSPQIVEGADRLLDGEDHLKTLSPATEKRRGSATAAPRANPQLAASEVPLHKTVMYSSPGAAGQTPRKTMMYGAGPTPGGQRAAEASLAPGRSETVRVAPGRPVAITPAGGLQPAESTETGPPEDRRPTVLGEAGEMARPTVFDRNLGQRMRALVAEREGQAATAAASDETLPPLPPPTAATAATNDVASPPRRRPRTGDWAQQASTDEARPGTHPYFRERDGGSVVANLPRAREDILVQGRRRGLALTGIIGGSIVVVAVGLWLLASRQQTTSTTAHHEAAWGLVVTSEPSGATVYSAVTGQELGKTPLELRADQVVEGPLEVHLSGYEMLRLIVDHKSTTHTSDGQPARKAHARLRRRGSK